ncbi:unnamed protein product [Oppiella nova]|uniref:PHD and RING finger domain-containing protein 1 n=1 Tax=Oppiella nova TaxID=334625 RepID=A0A7R9LTX4_9ACAR|nr:unnamed protein product [Oppiella nova]CAG2166915.1 unnamed protein product [Oppiella nova]
MCDESRDDQRVDQLNGSRTQHLDDDEEPDDGSDTEEDDDEEEDKESGAEGDDPSDDEEGEEDEESDDTDSDETDDEEDVLGTTVSASAASDEPNGVDSDVGSDGSAPTCYICLNAFAGQDIGSPDSCQDLHYFCLECIEEWSKQINTCPVDRKRFTIIYVRREVTGAVVMKIPIVRNVVPDADAVPDDVTYCEICGRCDREDRLLLCDGCDFGYHCECLTPPINTIPIEEWFCPDCYQRLFGDTSDPLAERRRQRRAIARTGASEAVRQRILQRRQPSSTAPIVQRRPKPATPRRRKRRSTKRKRKTTKRKTTKASKTTATGRRKRRSKKRRKKRRTKKSAFASRRLPAPPDARTRIASKLGIGPAPKSPFGLPSMKNMAYESIRKITDLRAAAGISHLSMFGAELDTYDPRVLINDDDAYDNDLLANGAVGVMARTRLPANRFISTPLKQHKPLLDDNIVPNGQSVDLLSTIMSSQTLLHSSSRDVHIGRDGSLHRLNRQNSSPLPVRNCANSSGQSSPSRSPPQTGGSAPTTTSSSPIHSTHGSPQRTDTGATVANSSYNYSFGSVGGGDNVSDLYEDIGAIKPPPPVLKTTPTGIETEGEDSKQEVYSDIESVGDNTIRDDEPDSDVGATGEDTKELVIDDQPSGDHPVMDTFNQSTDAIGAQSVVSNQQMDTTSDETSLICGNISYETSIDKTSDSQIDVLSSQPRQQTPGVSTSGSDKSVNVSKLAQKVSQKTNVKTGAKSAKQRRRPSIKDLFGDSDESDSDTDADIRRILTEQGSINVHYPIKIPIFLKNSIAKSHTLDTTGGTHDTKPSSPNLIDTTPPVDLNKWIAVTPTDTTGAERAASATTNKWKSIDSSVAISGLTTGDNNDTNKWKPIEDLSESCASPLTPVCESDGNGVSNDDKPLLLNIDIGGDQSSDRCLTVEPQDHKDSNNDSAEHVISEGLSASAVTTGATEVGDEEEGEIKEEDGHRVRRCRHGRIRRDKPKEASSRDREGPRHRSRSSESKAKLKDSRDRECGNKTIASPVSSDVVLSSPHGNVDFKEKTYEPKSDEAVPDGEENSAGGIGWKKLSNTTKMRSYRDGKPKDVELMFREREVSKKLVKKSIAKSGAKAGKESAAAVRHRAHEHRLKDQNRDVSAPTGESAPHHCRKHRTLAETSDKRADIKVRNKRKADDKSAGEGAAPRKRSKSSRSGTEEASGAINAHRDDDRHKAHKHHKSSRHKHSSDRKDGLSTGAGAHHLHRSSKHSHHSAKSKSSSASNTGADSDVIMHMIGSGSGASTVGPNKILRDHSSYADITPLDSKEIYAEGDRIVINVNFKRDANSSNKSRHQIQDTDCGGDTGANYANIKTGKFVDELSSQANAGATETANTCKRLSSKKDDSIYWASPPPSASQMIGSSGQSLTTTITRVLEPCVGDLKHSNRKSEGKESRYTGDDLPRFLPRSLHQSDVRPAHTTAGTDHSERSYGPHTPEGEYCEDQFMPTPTQDESLSPLISGSTSRSSPNSSRSTPGLSNGTKDDVYDPEAPLQSPPQHSSPVARKKSRPPDPKSPSPELQPPLRVDKLLSKRSPPAPSHRDLRRQQSVPVNDSKSPTKFASKEAPKLSTPLTNSLSASHSSMHSSPFKSPSLLPQRQQMKASPQKSVSQTSSQQQKSSSSSSSTLMPPPLPPTARPVVSAAALAAIATKINSQNLAQLLKMAQTLNSAKNSAKLGAPVAHRQPSRHTHSSSSTASAYNSSQNHNQSGANNISHNRDHNEVVDMDVESPSPPQQSAPSQQPRVSSTTGGGTASSTTTPLVKTLWDQIIKSTSHSQSGQSSLQKRLNAIAQSAGTPSDPKKQRPGGQTSTSGGAQKDRHQHHRHQVISVSTDGKKPSAATGGSKLDQLTVLDDVPSSAVEMAVKEKFIKKLNRQERVIEEVKLVLKPHYQKRSVTKDEYKEILRKSVPKICHSRSGEINPVKIKSLVEGYIKRYKYMKKKSKKLPKK